MPLRARARGSNSRTINAARIPQELIDAILDEFDLSPLAQSRKPHGSAELEASEKAVKSCALAARIFVRPSQMKLFSAVDLRTSYASPDLQTRKFSKLISSSPHIAAYVKTLLLSYRTGRSKTVDYILSSLGRLTSLLLHPWSERRWTSLDFPLVLRDSFAPALSLPSLQLIELKDHCFDSVTDLQALLCNSLALKSLILCTITFKEISPLQPVVSRPPRIVLNSLRLIGLKRVDIEELVRSFTTVDITHLHSLHLEECTGTSIVRANPSLREIKIGANISPVYYSFNPFVDTFVTEPLDKLLPQRNCLRTIHLEAYGPSLLSSMINKLGDLSKLDALKTVTMKITVSSDNISDSESWSNIDNFFCQLSGIELEEVNVSCIWFQDQIAAKGFRKLLPGLDKRGILHVSMMEHRWNSF